MTSSHTTQIKYFQHFYSLPVFVDVLIMLHKISFIQRKRLKFINIFYENDKINTVNLFMVQSNSTQTTDRIKLMNVSKTQSNCTNWKIDNEIRIGQHIKAVCPDKWLCWILTFLENVGLRIHHVLSLNSNWHLVACCQIWNVLHQQNTKTNDKTIQQTEIANENLTANRSRCKFVWTA